MTIWVDYIKYGWPIITGVAGFLVIVGAMWIKTNFVTRAEHRADRQAAEERERRIAEHDQRLSLLEAYQKQPPTRHDLGDGIAEVGERISKIEAIVEGIDKRVNRELDSIGEQLRTFNSYLHTLIDKGLGR